MIEVRGLVKHHGNLRVLNGASLRVSRGEVAVVIGPSGGGKSTLLRCINGLEAFQEGEVQVEDRILRASRPRAHANHAVAGDSSLCVVRNSVAGNSDGHNGEVLERRGEGLRELRRRVGMVFQQFHLFPHMNVLENVMAGPRYVLRVSRAEAEVEARKLLERVGLADKLTARPEQLSGGQQQRVAIARALAMHPEAMLFDEPTSALDPRMAAEVLSVIADLAQSGQTMVVVTHAMNFARQVAHRVHVMHEGRIIESDVPAAIFDRPREEVTRAFLMQNGPA